MTAVTATPGIATTSAPTRASRALPLFGAAAGLGGFVGSAILWLWIETDVKAAGPQAVVDALTDARLSMHVGTSVTWLAVAALVGFAVHYLRFLDRRVGAESTLVQTARLALTAGIGAQIITTALKSVVVGGIPGGIDAAMYDAQDVSTLHLLTDQLQWVGWMGVVVAMGVTAVLALRHQLLSRWFGIFSGLLTLFVTGMTLILGLPYSAGLARPLWLIVASVVLFRAGRREA